MRIINVNTQEKRMSESSVSYDCFLRDIRSCCVIEDEEKIIQYVNGVKKDDEKSMDKLVKSFIFFILSMAKLMNTDLLSVGDLVNEGCIGLIKAAKKFDTSRPNSYRFLSYAVWYIQANMIASINDFDSFIRLPQNMCELRKKIYKISNIFFVKNSYLPGSRKLSDIMEVSENSIELVLSVENNKIISTDDNCVLYTINETMETFGVSPLETYVSDVNDSLPDYKMIRESFLTDLRRSVSTLTKKEGQVLSYYFGILLYDNQEINSSLKLEDIAEMFDLTRERVRQILVKAIRRLKHPSRSKVLKKYLG